MGSKYSGNEHCVQVHMFCAAGFAGAASCSRPLLLFFYSRVTSSLQMWSSARVEIRDLMGFLSG